MTLTEIHQRLAKEFPGRNVSFTMEVNSYRYSNDVADDPDLQNIEIGLWDAEFGTFTCSNLDDGINQLKLKLGLVQPEMRIEI